MQRTVSTRSILLLLLLAASCAAAQLTPGIGFVPAAKPSAGIPATPPTAPTASALPAPQASQKGPRRAEVTFKDGQLAVKADNSSLNQILREVARTTGIKITGGVAEERVFGKYGPSSTADVLNALLDGTASNVLLLASDSTSPGELILTPRQGGPTPPNPNAPGFDDEANGEETQAPAFIPAAQRNFLRGAPPMADSTGGVPQNQGVPPTAFDSQPTATAPGAVPPTATGTGTTPTDPNGVKTPQQIYEQLQRLRNQAQPNPPQS